MSTYWGSIGSINHGYFVCMETQSFKNLSWISYDDWFNMVEKGITQFSKSFRITLVIKTLYFYVTSLDELKMIMILLID